MIMDCPFCQELEDVDSSEFRALFPVDELPTRTVAQDERFTVLAGIGAINPGYLLLIPRHHVRCLAQLDDLDRARADVWVRDIRETLTRTFGDPFIFEHGSPTVEARAGSCIDHAHLHFLPMDPDPVPSLKRTMSHYEVDSIYHISDSIGGDAPYLIGGKSGTINVFSIDTQEPPPSQYLRRVICNIEGRPDRWDWALFPEKDNIITTVRGLAGQKFGRQDDSAGQ